MNGMKIQMRRELFMIADWFQEIQRPPASLFHESELSTHYAMDN
jgi:hypothetical protein